MNASQADNEKKWNAAFKLATYNQKNNSGNQIPFGIQKKNLIEEIKYYKSLLLNNLNGSNQSEIKRTAKELIKRFAIQSIVHLQEQQADNHYIKKSVKNNVIQKYFGKCYSLLSLVNKITNQNAHK